MYERWGCRILLTLWLVVMLSCLTEAPAQAHAELVSSTPRDGQILDSAPSRVVLEFDEPVSAVPGTTLMDPLGRRSELTARAEGDRVVVGGFGALTPGSYILTWRAESDDGHVLGDVLVFSVGKKTPLPAAYGGREEAASTEVASVLRVVQYVGLLVNVGLACFGRFLLPPGARTLVARRITVSVRISGVVAVAATTLILVESRIADGGDRSWAPVWCIVAGVALTGVAVSRPPSERSNAVVITGAGTALVAPVLAGHSRTNDPLVPGLLADLAHLSGGTIWVGGVVGLLLSLPLLRESGLSLEAVRRFSGAGVAVLLTMAGTGLANAMLTVGSWSAVLETGWGRLLLVKVGLVIGASGIAGWNRWVRLPRATVGGVEANVVMRRGLRLEAGALLGVLIVTGFLGQLSPRESTYAGAELVSRQEATARGGGLVVIARLQPGDDAIALLVRDDAGRPVDPPEEVLATLQMGPDQPEQLELLHTDAGSYYAFPKVSEAGDWVLRVWIRDEPDAAVELSFLVQ